MFGCLATVSERDAPTPLVGVRGLEQGVGRLGCTGGDREGFTLGRMRLMDGSRSELSDFQCYGLRKLRC
jgi:hypothetical protein